MLGALLLPALVAAAPAQDVQRRAVVYFDWDSTEVTPEAAHTLDYVVQAMLAHPELKARLAGHTDREGSAEYNLAKSARMADTVARYLSDHGVLPARISSTAYGESRPAVETEDGVREPLNRRVEIALTGG